MLVPSTQTLSVIVGIAQISDGTGPVKPELSTVESTRQKDNGKKAE
jgi:hypothetical protein